MRTIVTPDEIKKLGRPIGKVSSDKITAFIVEIEQTIIRKALGDTFYLTILDEVDKIKYNEANPSTPVAINANIKTLLDGGTYTDSKGNVRMFVGLKVVESYFVYAQNVRAGDFESTRYGMVQKNDEYSQPISAKERDMVANNSTEIGNNYLNECITFCFDKELINRVGQTMHTTSGCVIRKIRN